MTALILTLAALLAAAMALAWAWQKRANNAGWVDVFWTFATGAAALIGALWPLAGDTAQPARQVLVVALAALW